MITKILGLLLMTPFIAVFINHYLWYADGRKWKSTEYIAGYLAVITVIVIVELFGVGFYFCFGWD
jgi:hypothetical protein